jgi:hypothetical protein
MQTVARSIHGPAMISPQKEEVMSIETIIVVGCIWVAVVGFAGVLAWADYRTSSLKRK